MSILDLDDILRNDNLHNLTDSQYVMIIALLRDEYKKEISKRANIESQFKFSLNNLTNENKALQESLRAKEEQCQRWIKIFKNKLSWKERIFGRIDHNR